MADFVGNLTDALTEAISILIEQFERIPEFLVYSLEETLDPFIPFNPFEE
jgi:hypothetical protein